MQSMGSQRVGHDWTTIHTENSGVLATQSCPTLCDPMHCSLPGSSEHGILQTRILEWVAISFNRESSWSRDQIRVYCTAGRFFNVWATREAQVQNTHTLTCVYSQPPRLYLAPPLMGLFINKLDHLHEKRKYRHGWSVVRTTACGHTGVFLPLDKMRPIIFKLDCTLNSGGKRVIMY